MLLPLSKMRNKKNKKSHELKRIFFVCFCFSFYHFPSQKRREKKLIQFLFQRKQNHVLFCSFMKFALFKASADVLYVFVYVSKSKTTSRAKDWKSVSKNVQTFSKISTNFQKTVEFLNLFQAFQSFSKFSTFSKS